MGKMLVLKKTERNTRKDGTVAVVPLLRVRQEKFGPVTEERQISVKRDLMLVGPVGSGKTRWLDRLMAEAPGIWRKKQVVRISALQPIGTWLDVPIAALWWDEKGDGRPWKSLKAHEREIALVDAVVAAKPVLFVDDAHCASLRKSDLLVRLIKGSSVVVSTTTSQVRLSSGVRLHLLNRAPDVVDFRSAITADGTGAFVWLLTAFAALIGAWPLAVAVGGMRLLAKGGAK